MLHSRGGGQGVAKAKGRLGGEGCITEGALKQEVQNGGEQNAVETKEKGVSVCRERGWCVQY